MELSDFCQGRFGGHALILFLFKLYCCDAKAELDEGIGVGRLLNFIPLYLKLLVFEHDEYHPYDLSFLIGQGFINDKRSLS